MNAPNDLRSLLRDRVDAHGNRVLYRWLSDDNLHNMEMSFAGLEEHARAIGASLQKMTKSGERVLLLYPPGIEFIKAFYGSVFASVIAIPAHTVPNARKMRRIDAIIRSAQPSIILTTSDYIDSGKRLFATLDHNQMSWLSTDDIDVSGAADWKASRYSSATDVLYLQYTSGSTAEPKGVMITNSNLLSNLSYIASDGDFGEDTLAINWLPHFHDMGLVYGWLQPIFSKFTSIQMSASSFMRHPLRWLRAISEFHGTHSGGPNFAYDLCVDRVQPEQRNLLDLSTWRVAFNGAEPILDTTLRRFAEYFEPSGFTKAAFYSVYGLAEATLKATSVTPYSGATVYLVAAEALQVNAFRLATPGQRAQQLVSCGRATGANELIVVNPDSCQVVPDGDVGEIWISGPSVATGYWNLPELTAEKFHARLANSCGQCYLRTGDLGTIHNGELVVTGRRKDLIIIRGRNYYPQDIEEAAIDSDLGVRRNAVAAFSILRDGQESVVVVAETRARSEEEWSRIANSIRLGISEMCDLQIFAIVLVAPGSLEYTSSGKLRRSAYREQFLNASLPSLYQKTWEGIDLSAIETDDVDGSLKELPLCERQTRIENYLLATLTRFLSTNIGQVSLADTPASLGLDSLGAAKVAHYLEDRFGVDDGIQLIMSGEDLRAIARTVSIRLGNLEPQDIPKLGSGHEEHLECPLSCGQNALWFLQTAKPTNTSWNITRGVRLCGALDKRRLFKAIHRTMERHPALRTQFHSVAGTWIQRFDSRFVVPIEDEDMSSQTRQYISKATQNFAGASLSLRQEPALRIALWRLSTDEHVLMFTIHHIISDLWSLGTVWQDIQDSYVDPLREIAAAPYTYSQFVLWQRAYLESETAQEQRKYWQASLSEPLPRTTLARATGGTRNARVRRTHRLSFDACLTENARRWAASTGTTLFTVLFSAFLVALSRETGEHDLLVGTPYHGRPKKNFHGTVGFFVNTLPIRAAFAKDLSFRQMTLQTSELLVSALANADYPFSSMLEGLRERRDLSLSPVVRTMFIFYGESMGGHLSELALPNSGATLTFGDLEATVLDVHEPMTQFDLSFVISEGRNRSLTGALEYDASLVPEEAISDFGRHFHTYLDAALAAPDRPINEPEILSEEETQHINRVWNQTDMGPYDQCIWDLLTRQMERSPDAVAVCIADRQITYEFLNKSAEKLANRLTAEFAIGPDSVVGICGYRSLEFMIALVAVAKTGGAYLPLDPDLPSERIRYMIEQADIAALISEPGHAGLFPHWTNWVSLSGTQWFDNSLKAKHRTLAHADNLAYVLFTSGSTGRPKGVMVSQTAIANRLLWMKQQYEVTNADVFLQKTPLTFDVSVWELFLPLIAGSRLVLAEPNRQWDPSYLAMTCEREQVTIIHFIPRMLDAMIEAVSWTNWPSLRYVICSGEALSKHTERRFIEQAGAQLHNLYGPTEAAIDVSSWRCAGKDQRVTVPIGTPITNVRLHVLDDKMRPVPIGASGELYIGGVALARGYIGRPDLTAASFLPCPLNMHTGARLYRTGDLARYERGGIIEYLGRIDSQYKIRGMRVEAEEVEAALRAQEGVRDAAVLLECGPGREELVGYVVLAPNVKRASQELRAALARILPNYMIPSRFIFLPQIPLSASGKLDRKALHLAEHGELTELSDSECPCDSLSPTESLLFDIWSRLLKHRAFTARDNFFVVGGYSLLALQMIEEIRRIFGVDLPLESLLSSEGTIGDLGAIIDRTIESRSATPLYSAQTR